MIPLSDDDSSVRSTPIITYGLVLANVVCFLMELHGGTPFILRWSFIPRRFLAHPVYDSRTIFTALFLHAGLLHLGGNMLYLWIFGNNVEDRLGHITYLVFYFVCGFAATMAQFMFSFGSRIPNLGASGAIAGVLAAYLLFFPRGWVNVLVFLFVVPLPAIVVIGLWFVLQLLNGVGSITATANTGGIAYLAHVGGFITGLILAVRLRPKRPRRTVNRFHG